MRIDPAPLHWSRGHNGLVTLDRWCAHGGSRSSFYRATQDGLLVPLVPGVAALVGTPVGPVQRIAAGVLGLGPWLLASHASSTFLWVADIVGDDPVEYIGTRGRSRTTRPGYVVHRPLDRHRVRHVLRHGIPTTSPCRTLLDLGASRPEAVERAVESFVRAGHVTVPALRAALQRARRSGRPGVTPLADALHELRTVTDSELETAMRRVFRSVGLGGWRFHDRVEGFEVDFCFRSERVVVEVDGWVVHGADARRWEKGLERDLVLVAAGWLVVHLSWTMVTRRTDAAVARLRSALEHRRGPDRAAS